MHERVRSRRHVALAVLATWVLAALAIAEGVPRLLGRRPWQTLTDPRTEPTLVTADPHLGWINKPGRYRIPPFLDSGRETDVTFLADSSRATGAAENAGGRPVVFVGCSVTEGYGLSDSDTFAWKIQQAEPALRVVNFGTPGYGTLQSLMRMERLIDESPPRLILYGFLTVHEPRNVATYHWLRSLARHSRRGHVAPPYVTLAADGGLVRHPPESYSVWPLADRLVTVRMADDAFMHLRTLGREAQGPEATKRLMREMTELARRHSIPFAVVFLLAEDGRKQEYVDDFARNQIPYIDCVRDLTNDDRIPGDGHPNEAVHSAWAQCIAAKLPELLR